jgi:hypothetical protein
MSPICPSLARHSHLGFNTDKRSSSPLAVCRRRHVIIDLMVSTESTIFYYPEETRCHWRHDQLAGLAHAA